MAVESQFDAWRQGVSSSIRKAVEAAKARALDDDGEISHSDRMTLALASAQITANVMIAERLGQFSQGLLHQDEAMAEAQQRTRSGEQILSRLLELIEAEGYDLSEDGETLQAMAEDWLEPDGLVSFTTPEAVESGADAFSRQGVESEDVPEAESDEAPEETEPS